MRFLSISWTVLANLISLLIVLALLNVPSTKFEAIVVSGLVLIYLNIGFGFGVLGRALAEVGQQRLGQFIELTALLGHPSVGDYRTAHEEQAEELQASKTKIWIGLGSTVIIHFVVLAYLLVTISR